MGNIVILSTLVSLYYLGLYGLQVNCKQNTSNNTASCNRLPHGFQVSKEYTLLELVKASPVFELMNPTAIINAGFTAGCNTYISIDGNNTFINFRVSTNTNGSNTIRMFLIRESTRGSNELVGFPERYGDATRVAYESVFATSCPNQKGTIFAIIRTFCYASSGSEEPYIYAVSLEPHPPSTCVQQITNTVNCIVGACGHPSPMLQEGNYSQPYACVTKYNGIAVINAYRVPTENSIELASLNLKPTQY